MTDGKVLRSIQISTQIEKTLDKLSGVCYNNDVEII